MIGGERPVKLTALERNRRFSVDLRLYTASAVTPSEKVQLTLMGSRLCALQ